MVQVADLRPVGCDPARRHEDNFTIKKLATILIATCLCLALASVLVAGTLISNTYKSNVNSSSSVTRPYIYTRRRYDTFFLPIERNLQQPQPHKESALNLTLNETGTVLRYFENPQLDADSVTEDDIILEALDQTYMTVLMHPNLQDFDKPGDRQRASDPAKVSRKRCKRELQYLLDKLAVIQETHARGGELRGFSADLSAFFDAFAVEEAGLLLGNNNWYGNWRQCYLRHILDLNYIPSNSGEARTLPISFTGRYCLASIRSPSWDKKVEEKIAELNTSYFQYPRQADDYRKYHRIQLGMCLPESCDSTLIEDKEHHDDLHRLALHRLREPFASYRIVELFCLPDPASALRKIDLSGWILLSMGSLWLLVLLVATLADYFDLTGLRSSKKQQAPVVGQQRPPKPVKQRLVLSLSLIQNWKRFVEVKKRSSGGNARPKTACNQDKGTNNGLELTTSRQSLANKPAPAAVVQVRPASPGDLAFLDFVKVAIMLPIVIAHIGMLSLQLCRFPLNYDPASDIFTQLQAGATFYVDWYFSITGFITAYMAFSAKAVQNNTALQWLYSVFHRYWRLAPGYVLLFWFARSLFQHTGSGPLWDYGTSNSSGRVICQRESWLYPLTLTSNFHPLYEECIMPSWYISNDLQFYLITPFLLLLLNKSAKCAWLVTLGIMGLVMAGRGYRYSVAKSVQPVELLRPRVDLVMRNNYDMYDTYLWPQYRVSAHLVGLLAGHYGYMVRSGQWNSPLYEHRSSQRSANGALMGRWPFSPLMRACLAWLGLALAIQMNLATWIMANLMPTWVDFYARPVATVIYSTDHTLAALGPCLIFLTVLLGQWPGARRFMEHKYWVYLTRINFFVYLSQVEVIIWIQSMGERMPDLAFLEEMRLLALLLPSLYLLALLATLLLASPLDRLEREFLGMHVARTARNKHRLGPVEADNNGNKCTNLDRLQQQQHAELRPSATASSEAACLVTMGAGSTEASKTEQAEAIQSTE